MISIKLEIVDQEDIEVAEDVIERLVDFVGALIDGKIRQHFDRAE